MQVTNTGAREGKEVVQVYVGEPAGCYDRPIRELKALRSFFRAGRNEDGGICAGQEASLPYMTKKCMTGWWKRVTILWKSAVPPGISARQRYWMCR